MAEDNRTQQVSLGIGTLSLIAVIVMIFGGGSGGIKREVQGLQSAVGDLRKAVGDLRKAVEAQSTEIRQLRDRMPPPVQSEGEASK